MNQNEHPPASPAAARKPVPARLRLGANASWGGRLILLWVVALDVALIHFQHYAPYEQAMNLAAVRAGARPAAVFWVVLGMQVFSYGLLARLLLASIPAGGPRARWLTAVVGLPLFFGGTGTFWWELLQWAEDIHRIVPALNAAGRGLMAAAGLAALATLGMGEGAGTFRSKLSGFIWALPWAVLLGAAAVALRSGSYFLEVVPGAGVVAEAGLNLAVTLGLMRAVGRLARPAHALRSPPAPSAVAGLVTGIVTMVLVGLALVVPGPRQELAAGRMPPLVARPTRLAFDLDDRGNKKIAATGKLRVMMGTDPFTLDVLDASDRAVLRLDGDESHASSYRGVALDRELRSLVAVPLAVPGRLLKARASLWPRPLRRAETVTAAGDELVATGRAGRARLAVKVSFFREDVVRIAVEAPADSLGLNTISIAFAAAEDERFFGLGSGRRLDRTGADRELLIEPGEADGPDPGDYVGRWSGGRAKLALTPGGPWPAPLVMSSRGLGFYLASGADPRLELKGRYGNAIRFSARGETLELYVIVAEDPLAIERKFAELVGPRPAPDPGQILPWATVSGGPDAAGKIRALCAGLREQGIPAEFVLLPPGALGPEGKGLPPELAGAVARGRELGFRFAFTDAASVGRGQADYREALSKGWLVINRVGLPYHFLTAGGSRAWLDFSNPKTVDWRQGAWKRLKAAGFSAMRLDGDHPLPPDAVLYGGLDGPAARNLHPLFYARAAAEGLGAETTIIAGSGFTGMERYAGVAWPEAADGGVAEGLAAMLNLSLAGAPMSGPGAAGAAGLAAGLAAPLMVLPEGPLDPALAKDLAERRARLWPYLYSLALAQAETGTPLARPEVLTAPADPDAYGETDQYRLGGGLLAAPILDPKAGGREVLFPADRWLDLESHELYGEGRRKVMTAQAAPLLFLGEGALLPMFDAGLDTLAAPGPAGRETRQGRADGDLTIVWIAGRDAEFTLFDGARLSARRREDSLLVRMSGGASRSYTWVVYDCDEVVGVFAEELRLDDARFTYRPGARVLTLPGLPGPELAVKVVLRPAWSLTPKD
jgi:alpha-glucosidase